MPALLVLFAVAGALTSLWMGGFVVYVNSAVGWSNLFSLPPTDFALFCFAAFGPVAAIWLVAGFLQQGLAGQRMDKILRLLVSQIRRNSDQMETQARTLIQMQAESRRRSVIDGMDLVLKDLNGQAAVLAERLGMISEDEANTLWARTVSGDVWAFAYAFLTRADAYPDFPELLAERLTDDEVSTAALQLFLRRYDSLLDSFKVNDADKLAREVLEDGPLARLHRLFAVVDRHVLTSRGHGPAVSDGGRTATAALGGEAPAMTPVAPVAPAAMAVTPHVATEFPEAMPIPRWAASDDEDDAADGEDDLPRPTASAATQAPRGAAMLFGESTSAAAHTPPTVTAPPPQDEELDYEPLYRPPPPAPVAAPAPVAVTEATAPSSGDAPGEDDGEDEEDERVARWLTSGRADVQRTPGDDAPTFIDLLAEEEEEEDRRAGQDPSPLPPPERGDWRYDHARPQAAPAAAATSVDSAGIEQSLARLHEALRRMNDPNVGSLPRDPSASDGTGNGDDAEDDDDADTLHLAHPAQAPHAPTARPRPAPPPMQQDPEVSQAAYRDLDPALVSLIRGDGLEDDDDGAVYPEIDTFAFPAPPPAGPARAARAARTSDRASDRAGTPVQPDLHARRDLLFGGPATEGPDAPPHRRGP